MFIAAVHIYVHPPKPVSLRNAGFATLEVALGSASPCPCVAVWGFLIDVHIYGSDADASASGGDEL